MNGEDRMESDQEQQADHHQLDLGIQEPSLSRPSSHTGNPVGDGQQPQRAKKLGRRLTPNRTHSEENGYEDEESRKKKKPKKKKKKKFIITITISSIIIIYSIGCFLHLSISSTIFDSIQSLRNQSIIHQTQLIKTSIILKPTLDSISITQPPPDLLPNSIDYSTLVRLDLSISFDLKSFLDSISPLSNWKSSLIHWFILRSPHSIINPLNSTILLLHPHHPPPSNSSTSLQPILSFQFIQPFSIPLIYPSHPSHHPIIPTNSTQLHFITRFLSPDQIIHLLHHATHHPLTRLTLSIDHLELGLDGSRFTPWISKLVQSYSRFTLSNLQSSLDFSLPDDLSSILKDPSASIQITNYSFHPITPKPNGNATQIAIRATGSVPNPFLAIQNYSDQVDLNLDFPWRFPLLINYLRVPPNLSTRDSNQTTQPVEPLATGLTSPLRLNVQDHLLSVDIDGILLDSLAHQNLSGPLTPFLNRFLKDQPNDLLIRYDSNQTQRVERLRGPPAGVEAIDDEEEFPANDDRGMRLEDQSQLDRSTILTQEVLNDHQLILGPSSLHSIQSSVTPTTNRPEFIERLLKHLDLRVRFPGSHQTQLIKSIEIQEMKIDLSIRFKILCSGEINGILDLPPQLETLSNSINITQIRPDVILLDGALPNLTEDRSLRRARSTSTRRVILSDDDDDDPRVDYPSNAFGRLKPVDWIDSKLMVIDRDRDPRIRLKARFDRVELEVLQGRSKVFRRFLAKYLLHHKRRSIDLADDLEDDPDQGVLVSILGSVDGLGSILARFPILIDRLDLSGSFYV